MVPVENQNVYELRTFVLDRLLKSAENDQLKKAFLSYFGLADEKISEEQISQNYLRCAISGLDFFEASAEDLRRLLGQSSFVDGTPRQWVSDIWAVLGIKWAVDKFSDQDLKSKFANWADEFLPQRIRDNRLSGQEKSIAEYIITNDLSHSSDPAVVLFLHYNGMRPLENPNQYLKNIESFLDEFKKSYKLQEISITQAMYLFVFDAMNREASVVPPNVWSKADLSRFLENIPVGLKRWTWEEKPRTKKSSIVKWAVENEYHVQNLLYVLLAPVFPTISDEIYLEPVGQKTPRADLYLPSINTIIEVKYKKDSKKTFQALIGEVAEDASLYRADKRFKDCTLIAFLWDHTRSTQEHTKFKEGVNLFDGVDDCVVISSPSVMDLERK